MTPNEFRSVVLSMPEAVESAHMNHPDFRVRGKIFATLGYPDESWGMVKLTPEQQQLFVRAEPDVFAPVKGGWGARGATRVALASAQEVSLRPAVVAAWCNVAPKRLARIRRGARARRSRPEPARTGDAGVPERQGRRACGHRRSGPWPGRR